MFEAARAASGPVAAGASGCNPESLMDSRSWEQRLQLNLDGFVVLERGGFEFFWIVAEALDQGLSDCVSR